MAVLQVGRGLEEYLQKLGNLANKSEQLCEDAARAGGNIVADTIHGELSAIPTDEHHGTSDKPKAGPRAIDKAGLEHSFGVAPVRNDKGFINVKVGFDGYNQRGKPNAMIARSVVRGTSFMKRNDFVGRGTRKSREAAEQKMKLTVDERIHAIMDGDSSYTKV